MHNVYNWHKCALCFFVQSIPYGQIAMCNTAKHPAIRNKNRFKNVLPYDHSRVKLNPNKGQIGSDYINANYIKGYQPNEMFIASHGPTTFTIKDFWRMVYEQKVCCVVMATNIMENHKKKCEKYWPDEGMTKQCGELTITNIKEIPSQDMVIRKMTIQEGEDVQELTQCHYIGWPDHGVPQMPASLIRFHLKCREFMTPGFSKGQLVVVHCSAGIGRTGTFIALDWLLQQAKYESVVDPFYCVQLLRESRMNMVQNFDQYSFLHRAVAEAIIAGNTIIKTTDIKSQISQMSTINAVAGTTFIECQFRMLQKLYPSFTSDQTGSALLKGNRAKNRGSFYPDESHRVVLTSSFPGRSDYINAVHVSGRSKKNTHVATHWPTEDTCVDFWRMLNDYQMPCVVLIRDAAMQNSYPDIVPPEEKPFDFGNLRVQSKPVCSTEGVLTQEVTIGKRSKADNDPVYCNVMAEAEFVHCIRFVHLTWPAFFAEDALGSQQILHDVTKTLEATANLISPTVVVCRDGRSWTGIFIALSSVLSSIKGSQQEVDFYCIAQRMKSCRPEFFLQLREYKAILDFMELGCEAKKC
ncbi:hypothetical protein CAPTEDRAFT_177598 [Capitella teleta]|uniref:protein-tyrosine-phosphatase n=1 Tax=Capitella teleta TaxID=283909 RepID=R7UGS3_CAPTE|nr:hypothetical protein CAPTEDRAFT_177598 [Capitella teleta]|eukprot:ELU05420.1 hypothetical protein CAPTEDRAFT_177598 [Capitella teleta]